MLVGLGLSGYAFDDIVIVQCTGLFEHERSFVRVPFANDGTLIIYFTRSNEELRSVRYIECSECHACLFIHETELVKTADDDDVTIIGRDRTEVINLYPSVTRQGIGILRCSVTCDTTRVEGTKCQLCTRLTDGLCSDDADSLTFLNHLTGSEVTAVALSADTMFGLAGEYRADFHFLNASSFDSLTFGLANLFASIDDDITFVVEDIVYRNAAEDTLSERSNNGIVLLDSACCESAEGTAVLFGDDNVVRNIDKTTCEVTSVGGLQSGIGQTLTSTVRRYEVLQHGQAFFKVRQDRVLNGLTAVSSTGFLRFSHKSTETC